MTAADRAVLPSLSRLSETDLRVLGRFFAALRDKRGAAGGPEVAELFNELAIACDDELGRRAGVLRRYAEDLDGITDADRADTDWTP